MPWPSMGQLLSKPPVTQDNMQEYVDRVGLEGAGLAGITKFPEGFKFPPLWHGVKTQQLKDAKGRVMGGEESDAVYNILKDGFTRGSSAELKLPGTSVSYDPLVSAQLFSPTSWVHGKNKLHDYLLRVEPKVPPKGLLSPSEYVAGVTPGGGEIYLKPQHFFGEAELFGERAVDAAKLEMVEPLRNKIWSLERDINSNNSRIKELLELRPSLLAEGRSDPIKRINTYKEFNKEFTSELNKVKDQLAELNYKDPTSPFNARQITEREAAYVKQLGDRYEKLRESIKDHNPGINSPFYNSPKDFIREFTSVNRRAPGMFRGSMDGWRVSADQVFDLIDPYKMYAMPDGLTIPEWVQKDYSRATGGLFKSEDEINMLIKKSNDYRASRPIYADNFHSRVNDLKKYSRTHGRPKSIENLPENLRKDAEFIDKTVSKHQAERMGLIKYLEHLSNR